MGLSSQTSTQITPHVSNTNTYRHHRFHWNSGVDDTENTNNIGYSIFSYNAQAKIKA